MLTEQEQEQFQDMIMEHGGPGAETFPLAGGYEIHPRGGRDFPEPVQAWLAAQGFIRAVDVRRGPFYRRDKEVGQ